MKNIKSIKSILCYGDSLTWGYDPETINRYPFEQRWTGFLQHQLGLNYRIIEEGLNGRSTAFDDPFVADRNGSNTLPLLLESHAPLDLIILLLGTNDLKEYIKGSAKLAAIGCSKLVRLIMASQTNLAAKSPNILLLSPPIITKPLNFMATIFDGAEKESKKFAEHYRNIADFFKINFLDTSQFIQPSRTDGVHLDVNNNKLLAEKVAIEVEKIFSKANAPKL
ncbi:MAG: SGNH/GDSL hydrolase family protein [Gammaproteobacteria bacterium]